MVIKVFQLTEADATTVLDREDNILAQGPHDTSKPGTHEIRAGIDGELLEVHEVYSTDNNDFAVHISDRKHFTGEVSVYCDTEASVAVRVGDTVLMIDCLDVLESLAKLIEQRR